MEIIWMKINTLLRKIVFIIILYKSNGVMELE